METVKSAKLKIVICDDEIFAMERLQKLTQETLGKHWELELVCLDSPQAALMQTYDAHIAILDIQISEQSGIALAQTIIAQNPKCTIIFVSGFVQYVSDVYDVPHFCMVLKDQLSVQLPKFLLRAATSCGPQEKATVLLTTKGATHELDIRTIHHIERRGHITYINLKNGQQLQLREKLDELLDKIRCQHICRCHISYAVNLQWVETMRETEFVMRSGEIIPISRSNKQLARKQYFDYLKSKL